MFDGLLYAAFYGFVLAFAIGPVFFTLIETSITKGIKAAIFFDLGSLFSDVVFIGLALLCLGYNQVALESYLEKLPVLTTKYQNQLLKHSLIFLSLL